MVFRALMVGWVLVLASWCGGQEVTREVTAAQWPVKAVHKAEAVDIDGQRVRFVMHRVLGHSLDLIDDLGNALPGSWPAGYTITAIPVDAPNEAVIVWCDEYQAISIPFDWLPTAEREEIWWDQESQRLWVATAFTSAHGAQYIRVHRIAFARQTDDGGLIADGWASASGAFMFSAPLEVLQGDGAPIPRSEFDGKPRITSMRFVRADDGEIDLMVQHPERTETKVVLPRRVEVYRGERRPVPSEELEKAVREDLPVLRALTPPILRRELRVNATSETPVVKVDGQDARFVLHWVGGGTLDMTGQSWNGPGFALTIEPSDSPETITTLWHERSYRVRMSIPIHWWPNAERTALWWDDERGELWIALAFTTSVGEHEVRVWCMRPDRTPEANHWFVNRLEGNGSHYTATDFVVPNGKAEGWQSGAQIKAMRFVRADDGGVDLEIEFPEGSGTTLDLTRDLKPMVRMSLPPVSDTVKELIREDLAERQAGGE